MPLEDLTTHFHLSSAEREVLFLVGRGLSNCDIAERLCIGVRGVESRLHRFALRSSFANRALVAWSARHERCCLVNSSEWRTGTLDAPDTSPLPSGHRLCGGDRCDDWDWLFLRLLRP